MQLDGPTCLRTHTMCRTKKGPVASVTVADTVIHAPKIKWVKKKSSSTTSGRLSTTSGRSPVKLIPQVRKVSEEMVQGFNGMGAASLKQGHAGRCHTWLESPAHSRRLSTWGTRVRVDALWLGGGGRLPGAYSPLDTCPLLQDGKEN